ncbi:universal stress protein [Bacillus sp. AK128]
MMKSSRILVAYDGSDLSEKALEYAKMLVLQNENSELVIVTVIQFLRAYETYSFNELKKAVVAEANEKIIEVKKMLQTIPNKTGVELLEGDPAIEITKYAEEKNVDLIVIGSRGLGKVRELFLGSVSHNVVQTAKCPVFIIK